MVIIRVRVGRKIIIGYGYTFNGVFNVILRKV